MPNDNPTVINPINPYVKILTPLTDERCMEMMMLIERAGRTCYQSESKGDPQKFISGIIQRGHESVIEHAVVSVEITTDRAVTHELVRHRVAAYSQESTRYVKYDEGTYIIPIEFLISTSDVGSSYCDDEAVHKIHARMCAWSDACHHSQEAYKRLLDMGCQKQEARAVLNNSLKTTIVATYNLREWRHVFKLRCAKSAHAHIKEVMIPTLLYFQKKFPGVFDDIEYDEKFYKDYYHILDQIVQEDFIEVAPSEHIDHNDMVDSLLDGAKFLDEMLEDRKLINNILHKKTIQKEATDDSDAPAPNDLVYYVAQLKMRGSYKYTPTGGILLKELMECTTSFRLQTLRSEEPIEVIPFSEVRETVYLTAAFGIREHDQIAISEVFNNAMSEFKEILLDHNRQDLIPYLEKITLGSTE